MTVYQTQETRALIALALAEDLAGADDITCRALVPPGARLRGTVKAKSPGVVCGLPVFAEVFAALSLGAGSGSSSVTVTHCAADGRAVVSGEVVLDCHGDARVLLIAERTALNICQRLSGTATATARYVEAVAGTRAQILDTRKTSPGLRYLQKHAVAAGGGRNHRLGLYDQVLIKDNHIALMLMASGAGLFHDSQPAEAVHRCRALLGESVLVEVEIERLGDLEPVILAGADIVLLDNMPPTQLRQAVSIRDGLLHAKRTARAVALEASGGITMDTVRDFADSGVDRISIGDLTHSAPALDLSLRCAPLLP